MQPFTVPAALSVKQSLVIYLSIIHVENKQTDTIFKDIFKDITD